MEDKSVRQKRIITDPTVLLCDPKYPHNVATIIRACSCFGISNLLWTGDRVDPKQYERLPREERMKGYKDVSWKITQRPFDEVDKLVPVCVELVPNAQNILRFEHPKNAMYVFGPEDGSVPQVLRRFCHHFIFIPSAHCLNLSAAVNIVLFHRQLSLGNDAARPVDALLEHRGQSEIDDWSGQSWSEYMKNA